MICRLVILTFMIFMLSACNLGTEEEFAIELTEESLNPVAEETEENAAIDMIEATDEIEASDDTTQDVEEPARIDDRSEQSSNSDFAPACLPRTDWFQYSVTVGDTLFEIAESVNSTVAILTEANCLVDANALYVGQILYVPTLPQPTPVATQLNSGECIIFISARTPVVNSSSGTGRTTLGYLESGTWVTPIVHFEGSLYRGISYGDTIGWVDVAPTGDCSDLPQTLETDNVPTGDTDGPACYVNLSTSVSSYDAPFTHYIPKPVEAGTYPVVATAPGGWVHIETGPGSNWIQASPQGNCDNVPQNVFNCMFVIDTLQNIYARPGFDANVLRTSSVGEEFRFGQYDGTWQETTSDGTTITGNWIRFFYAMQPPVSGFMRDDAGSLVGDCPAP